MYSNSSFSLFEGLTKDKVVLVGENENGHNITNFTTNGGRKHHISYDYIKGGYNNSDTMSKVHGKNQNGTTTQGRSLSKTIGLKSGLLISSPTDSTLHTKIHEDKEKLLDGLLASRFDDASCISRLQFHLYRKVSPHKPSSYLISKLRNYEKTHRMCGPNSRAFNKSMTKILHSKNNKGGATMCKYLIWTPSNGLGNQMISMVATFLYALLTNRVLL
ncbi:galactoside 2-alpha-L-fucosyltransferase-like, partial [Cicer arietinum]|uniref:Fucosyltransferase n=1 Tax=Cicer arietinum TaxID=3827 RepID=A0A1S2Z8V5_CICAR